MTDEFADWDAAYLVGALSPVDRARYEEHLAGCASCRQAVAELAPSVGLLSRVPAGAIAALEEPAVGVQPAPTGARDALIRRVRRGDRRRLGARIGIAATGIAIIAAAIVVPLTVWGSGAVPEARPSASALPPAAAMTAVTQLPLTASVRLVHVGWGTRIDLSCRYTSTYGAADEVYALAVVSADGSTTQLSTWRVLSGADAHISAGTALDPASIRSVQIRDAAGAVLMTYTP